MSDLHLAPRERDEEDGDFRKVQVLGATEKWVKTDVIRHSLAELARRLRENGDTVEALVISGDITEANREDGFALLEEVLSELGDRRPPPEHTIVVPGNHDVAWQRSPFGLEAAEQRYANFEKYVRARGYITPLLRGIDYSEDGVLWNAEGHLAEAEDGRWLIVPVNSSHFCGRAIRLSTDQHEAWERAAAALGVPVTDVGEKLGIHAAFDIARVDPQQLMLLSHLLSQHSENTHKRPCSRLFVLHHHLQPVNAEEFKEFESLSNLGNVRDFLREQRFDVVLHGHKHTSALYYDHIYTPDGVAGPSPRRVLVIASPAPAVTSGRPILRLVRLGDEPRSGSIGITSVPVTSYGGVLSLPDEVLLQLWRDDAPGPPLPPTIIEGSDLDTTYARIQALFEGLPPSAQVHGLICRTDPPAHETKYRVPECFPSIPGVDSLDLWFAEMVRWWQQPASRLDSSYFTHGSRIRRYGPAQVNQLDQAVDALRSDPKSTRAVITLLIPGPEPARPGGFPSFCQLHLVIRDAPPGVPQLEALAYFRKQEMRYLCVP